MDIVARSIQKEPFLFERVALEILPARMELFWIQKNIDATQLDN
jgi:hypothetical protein